METEKRPSPATHFERLNSTPKPPLPDSANGIPTLDEPKEVREARLSQGIAEAQEEALKAQKRLEALKAGFPDAESWNKAQEEFKEQVEKTQKELQAEREGVDKLKAEYENNLKTVAEREQKLKEQLKLAGDKIDEQEEINGKARKDAEENITRILRRFKGGTIGIMEKALFQLTTPIVTRAYIKYTCPDCHKDGKDKVDRVAVFEIPRLKDCPPNFMFGVCGDCELDQKNNRRLPFYICDICPVEKIMLEASQFIVEALATVGIKADFDADGQYKPTTYIDAQSRHLTKEEQFKLLMQDYNIEKQENNGVAK